MSVAAMLWTGGKDSALALYEAQQGGYHVPFLVTFAPPNPDFLAHPLSVIQLQAQALNLSHRVVTIVPPFEKSYEDALRSLRETGNIDTVITGDIAEVGGAPNWIRERSRPVGMNVHTPLWGRDRKTLLQHLVDLRFRIRFSCVKTRWLTDNWVGRELDAAAIRGFEAIRENNGLDLCGEEGEYHTLTTDAPNFTHTVDIASWSTRAAEGLAHMQIRDARLVAK